VKEEIARGDLGLAGYPFIKVVEEKTKEYFGTVKKIKGNSSMSFNNGGIHNNSGTGLTNSSTTPNVIFTNQISRIEKCL
jgi:hypothetical protein